MIDYLYLDDQIVFRNLLILILVCYKINWVDKWMEVNSSVKFSSYAISLLDSWIEAHQISLNYSLNFFLLFEKLIFSFNLIKFLLKLVLFLLLTKPELLKFLIVLQLI
jgi:hypothetical protein